VYSIYLETEMSTYYSARWFSAALILNPRNPDEILMMKYWRDRVTYPDQRDIKFPGGKEKRENGRQDDSPLITLLAEVKEEVLTPSADDLHHLVQNGTVRVVEIEGAQVHLPGHTKHFYLVIGLKADLREQELVEMEDDGREEVLSPPFWMGVEDIAQKIFRGHGVALMHLCRACQDKSPAYERALRILESRRI